MSGVEVESAQLALVGDRWTRQEAHQREQVQTPKRDIVSEHARLVYAKTMLGPAKRG